MDMPMYYHIEVVHRLVSISNICIKPKILSISLRLVQTKSSVNDPSHFDGVSKDMASLPSDIKPSTKTIFLPQIFRDIQNSHL